MRQSNRLFMTLIVFFVGALLFPFVAFPTEQFEWQMFRNVYTVIDLTVSKGASPDPAMLYDPVTYTVVVGNLGTWTATGVVVTDDLPAQVDLLSVSSTQGWCTGTSQVTCSLGSMPPGAEAYITIVVQVMEPGILTNHVEVTGNEFDSDPGNNAATHSLTVRAADLAVIKSDLVDPGTIGEPEQYQVTVQNLGPSAAMGVTLVDTLSGAVSQVTVVPSQGSCSGTSPIVCDLGTLNVDASATVDILLTPTALGTISNVATASCDETDPVPDNDEAVETTTVVVGKSVPLIPGEPTRLTYTEPDGRGVIIDVPAGATSGPLTLLFVPLPDLPHPLMSVDTAPAQSIPQTAQFAGQAFSLLVYDDGTLLPDYQFSEPAGVELVYVDEQVESVAEASLVIGYWDGSEWVDVCSTCGTTSCYTRDLEANSLHASLCQTGDLALFGEGIARIYLPLIQKSR